MSDNHNFHLYKLFSLVNRLYASAAGSANVDVDVKVLSFGVCDPDDHQLQQ
jgi:hypothetical protein